MITRTHVNWEDFNTLCLHLAAQIKNSDDKRMRRLRGIVAVSRGGLVPAAIIAYALKMEIWEAVQIPPKMSSNSNELLIVDDISDTGKTFATLRRSMPNAVYVSAYVKPQGKPLCDFWAKEVAQDNWVVFPWAPNDEVNR
jgi:xanthine phosphoribosyltransferase